MVISVHGFSVILGIFMVKILSLQVSLAFSICILPSIFRYHPEIFIWGMLCYAMLCQVTSVVSDSVRPHRRQPTRLPRPWDSPGKNAGVGCHFLLHYTKVRSESEVAQSCPTLSDPMDCSLPDPSVHGIFQARVLEWGAITVSEVKE